METKLEIKFSIDGDEKYTEEIIAENGSKAVIIAMLRAAIDTLKSECTENIVNEVNSYG